MDIEGTIEFILKQSANTDARLDRLAEKQEKTEAQLDQLAEQQKKTGATLRRAITLSVREHRNERVRRQKANEEFDLKITQLAAAQIVSEEKLKTVGEKLDGLIEALRLRQNGHSEGPRP